MATDDTQGIGSFGLHSFRHIPRSRATVLCVLVLGSLTARSQSTAQGREFLVAIKEGQMELSRAGGTSSDCIVVLPDGRLHLERRKHQISQTTGSLSVFEASLDQERLGS